MSLNLAEEEHRAADCFLASLGLYRRYGAIYRMVGEPYKLAGIEVATVQGWWDREWERINPPIKERISAEKAAIKTWAATLPSFKGAELDARIREYNRDRERDRERHRLTAKSEAQRSRKEKDRARYFNEHMCGGISEHHLYGPRGFKHPFKYEEAPEEMWATQTLFRGRVGGPLSYRPSRPLADNQALSIVTGGICGDPPKGRSALEKQAALHA